MGKGRGLTARRGRVSQDRGPTGNAQKQPVIGESPLGEATTVKWRQLGNCWEWALGSGEERLTAGDKGCDSDSHTP